MFMPIIAIGMGDYDLVNLVKLGHSHLQSQRVLSEFAITVV